jgi:hypothetical protein
MLIRMGLNFGVHAAAGVATAGLLVLAAEGWRRAYKAGQPPAMKRGGHGDEPDPDVARHDWIDEEAEGGGGAGNPATGGTPSGGGSGAGSGGPAPA